VVEALAVNEASAYNLVLAILLRASAASLLPVALGCSIMVAITSSVGLSSCVCLCPLCGGVLQENDRLSPLMSSIGCSRRAGLSYSR